MDFSNNSSRSNKGSNDKRTLDPTLDTEALPTGETSGDQQGEALFNRIVQSTGLPSEWVSSELDTILDDAGQDRSSMTLEDLRAVMLTYLESTLAEMENVTEEEANAIDAAFNDPSTRRPIEQ